MNRPHTLTLFLLGRLLLPAALIVATTVTLPAAHGQSLRRSAVVKAVEFARPSVVNINGQKVVSSEDHHYTKESQKRVNGMGTGVVVDSRGYILTNYHVVEGVRRIRVTLANGQAYIARLVAHDPPTDLAIIKIPTPNRMRVIRVGSSRTILTGETVIAVGNAYGYEHTVTTGIVSAQHRNVQVNDKQSYRNLIQTDASINPGNSGGPLLNIDGEMIGINVAVRVGAQGIGFAIPVDQGMQVAARLMSAERISGVWHGVIHEDKAIGNATQVVVRHVQPGSPAEKAGLREGDVIRQVADRKVGRGLDLECALIGCESGTSIQFAVERDSRPMDVKLGIVGSRKRTRKPPLIDEQTSTSEQTPWSKLGMDIEPLSAEAMRSISENFRGGLRVLSVQRDGVAELQGIEPGDLLVGIHVWETVSIDNLRYILSEADFAGKQEVLFYVVRNGKTLSGTFPVASLR